MFRKITALSLALVLALSLFAGCSGTQDTPAGTQKLSIVCTVFPMYDWVKNILGEKASDADVTLLLDTGTDLHSYQPTAEDIIKITSADVFVFVGGESDKWVKDVASTADVSGVAMVGLIDALGDAAVEEETVEGMEAEEEEDEEEGEEEPEYDEHVWLSLKNARVLCEKLAAVLGEKDAANASVYTENAKAYCEKLDALDIEFADAVTAAEKDTVLVADRFPFRYLCMDYNINYYAAFSGCSAESEAAFSTITFLADKVNELGLDVILMTETSDGSIARTVRSTAGNEEIEILTLNAMQSVTADKASGTSYIEVMAENLGVLTQALS